MLPASLLNNLLTKYTAASRTTPPAPLTGDDEQVIRDAGFPAGVALTQWVRTDVARFQLLQALTSQLSADDFAEAASACFTQGDASEQRSWCRAVSLLPQPERFLSLMTDTCRTNILPLFESIACDNPYPAQYFPELNFNQMVLKAMFNAVSLARIVGLAERRNAELTRMSNDYADERTAAGRSIPPDIHLAR